MLDKAWPLILPWLEAAMKRGVQLYDPSDVLDACRETRMVLWVAIEDGDLIGMTVTSVEKYPRKTLAIIKWGGGRLGKGREWLLPMVATLRQWAANCGATSLMGMGRRGWLRGFGFEEDSVTFTMDIAQ